MAKRRTDAASSNRAGSMEPTSVFDTYWQFAAERQEIYFRRLTGQSAPWTDDAILQNFRFTNAYRASDRVSQYLIREIQYRDGRSSEPAEVFFRTMLFKLFNRVETWEALEAELGPISYARSDLNAIDAQLTKMMSLGDRIYSAAYIMPSPALGYKRKHSNHLALIEMMMADRTADRLRQSPDLRTVYDILLRYPGLGPFLAFQFATDLNYSTLLNHDEAEFVIAGPGARDGISKCFASTGKSDAEAMIHWMCDRQEVEFAKVGVKFRTLFGRRLQPIDCQNLFCEISKYARVAHPEVLGLSGRTRIKQIYRPAPSTLPTPVFPPSWNLTVELDAAHGQHSQERAPRQGLLV